MTQKHYSSVLVPDQVFVAQAGEAGLTTAAVVYVSGTANGYLVVKQAHANVLAEVDGFLGVVLDGVDGNATPNNGDLIRVQVMGVQMGLVYVGGPPVVGNKAYVTDTGRIGFAAGTNPRVVGEILAVHVGNTTFDVVVSTEEMAIGTSKAYIDAGDAASVSTAEGFATAADAVVLAAAHSYTDAAVVGLLDFKGSQDCSGNPNYPAALKGDAYLVSVAGMIGGGAGARVDSGDVYFAIADNAGGTQAGVGASWDILEHNLVGALLAANNLSDLTSAATARTNLGLGTAATHNTEDYDSSGSAAAAQSAAIADAQLLTVLAKNVGDSPYTASASDRCISWNAAAGCSQLLPAGTAGRKITIVKGAGGASVIITPNGAETINGAATFTLSQAPSAVTLVFDGTSNWLVLAEWNVLDALETAIKATADAAMPKTGGTWTGPLVEKWQAVADTGGGGSHIQMDASVANCWKCVLSGANKIVDNPTNLSHGQPFELHILQPGGAGGTIASWGTMYTWDGGSAPTMPATANHRLVVAGRYDSGVGLLIMSAGVDWSA